MAVRTFGIRFPANPGWVKHHSLMRQGGRSKWLAAQLVTLLLTLLSLGFSARLGLPRTIQPTGREDSTFYTTSQAQASVQSLLNHLKQQDPSLDTRGTLFPSTPQLTESEEDAYFLLDLERARLLGKLVSVSYCVDPAAIAAWQCTRCKRVSEFQLYKVGPSSACR
jgi:hypothetical protein